MDNEILCQKKDIKKKNYKKFIKEKRYEKKTINSFSSTFIWF